MKRYIAQQDCFKIDFLFYSMMFPKKKCYHRKLVYLILLQLNFPEKKINS